MLSVSSRQTCFGAKLALDFWYHPGLVERVSICKDDPVEVLRLRDGLSYMLGDGDGAPVASPNGERLNRLSLNVPLVAEVLRKLALPEVPTGAAHVRWPADIHNVSRTNGLVLIRRITPTRRSGFRFRRDV